MSIVVKNTISQDHKVSVTWLLCYKTISQSFVHISIVLQDNRPRLHSFGHMAFVLQNNLTKSQSFVHISIVLQRLSHKVTMFQSHVYCSKKTQSHKITKFQSRGYCATKQPHKVSKFLSHFHHATRQSNKVAQFRSHGYCATKQSHKVSFTFLSCYKTIEQGCTDSVTWLLCYKSQFLQRTCQNHNWIFCNYYLFFHITCHLYLKHIYQNACRIIIRLCRSITTSKYIYFCLGCNYAFYWSYTWTLCIFTINLSFKFITVFILWTCQYFLRVFKIIYKNSTS